MFGLKKRWVAWMLLCSAFLLHSSCPVARAEDEPSAVRSAKRLIESEGSWILFFAHPTGTFKDVTFEGYRKKGDGYVVSYTITWVNIFDTTLKPIYAFEFDAEGVYQDCRRTAAGGGVFPPFVASDLILGFLKDAVRDDPDLQQNKKLQEMLEETDAKELLKMYLRFKQGADDESLRKLVKALNNVKKSR